jgi:Uma2 family endonuclease
MNSPAPVAARRATYQDVLDAPEHVVAELIGGALSLQPRPRPRHAIAASRLGGRLAGFDADDIGPGGWMILDEPELHVGEDVVVPDLAGWRRGKLAAIPDAFFTVAPDWCCEVLSPSTRARDLGPKRDIYAAAGVSHLWLLDPEARTLEAFALDAGRWLLLATLVGAAEVRLPPFEAAGFPLSALWSDPPAADPAT